MLHVVERRAKPPEAARPPTAAVAPTGVAAEGVGERIAENVSENRTKSQGVAFETRMSGQHRDLTGGGSGLREGVDEAMAGSLLARVRGRDLVASGRDSPVMAA